jgi:large subunit ribosomal protein L23
MFKFLDKFKRTQAEKVRVKKDEKRNEARAKEEKVSPKRPKKEAREMKSSASKVLIEPLVTEKISALGEQGQYAFRVMKNANKIQVLKSVEELYGVNVASVNMMRVKGKQVVFGRTRGTQKDWKKAIVTVGKGEKIDVYEK